MLKTFKALDILISQKLSIFSHKNWIKFLLVALELSGNGLIWFFVSFYLYVASVDDVTKINITIFVIGLLTDLILVGSLKYSIRRPRPKQNDTESYMISIDSFSFPSGHTTRVAYIFYFIINILNSSFLCRLLVAVWCFCVAISRVMLSRHYISDVICGAFIGRFNFFLVSYLSSSIYYLFS